MALGTELGDFNMKSTSITLHSKGDKVTAAEVNFEGNIAGNFDCFAIATMTVESGDGVNGDYAIAARCFMADGRVVDATGKGKTTHSGGQIWSVAGTGSTSERMNFAVRGDIDLQNRSYVGKMFERQ